MSTRGAIARLTCVLPPKWAGRYHHWDAYPSGLGATLWQLYHGHFQGDLASMLKVLIDDHPAGWSSLNAADFDLEPGFIEPLSQTAESEEPQRPQCYCHGERREKGWLVTDENAAGSGCEWAYAFTSAATTNGARHDTMLVLSSYSEHGKMIGMFGMGDPQAVWPVVAVVDLHGEEPDWEEIAAAKPLDPMFPLQDPRRRRPTKGAPVVQRDAGRRGTYMVRSAHEPVHYVSIRADLNDTPQIFCTCNPQEEDTSPDCSHARAVLSHLDSQRAQAEKRQQRGLAYSGWRVQTAKTHSGDEGRSEVIVLVWEAGCPRLLSPAPSQSLHNHSPCGFEWGYAGSGPAQLALAILLDYTGDEELALLRYQKFKSAVITPLPREGSWEISAAHIEGFLATRRCPQPATN